MLNIIKDDLNKLVNEHKFDKNKYIDNEIESLIGNHINNYYVPYLLVHDFKVVSNYPDVEIYIQLRKISKIETIRLEKFDRMLKLKKLKEIN